MGIFKLDKVWGKKFSFLTGRGGRVLYQGSRKAVEEGLERGRKGYLLELRSNAAGRLLLCSVCSVEERRFTLVFPEGRVVVVGGGGGGTLARKLRSLGISSNHKAEKLPIVDMPPVAVSTSIKSTLHVEERPLKMILKDGRAFDIFGCDFFRIPRIKLDCWVVRVRD